MSDLRTSYASLAFSFCLSGVLSEGITSLTLEFVVLVGLIMLLVYLWCEVLIVDIPSMLAFMATVGVLLVCNKICIE